MDGYALSLEELRTTCHRVAAAADEITWQAGEVRHSEVVSSDFGATGSTIGAAYVEVTHSALANSLEVFRTASDEVTSRLMATFAEYQRVDEENSMRLRH
jgi:hypothetical protein